MSQYFGTNPFWEPMSNMRTLTLAAFAVLVATPGPAQQQAGGASLPAPPAGDVVGAPVQATLAAGPVRVDASLDEAVWAEAQPIDLAYEWFPGDNAAPPVRTECRVAYDDTAVYVGCTALDPEPSLIRANFTNRDQAAADDHLVFLFDPFNDRRRAFQFRVNPLGVQMDAIFAEGFEDFSWDAIWSSAGRVTAEGYVVEAAIPFKSLRFPRGAAVQTWGFIAERSYPRSVRHRIRSVRTDRSNSCLLCQSGQLGGLRGIAPGRDVELNPTLTAGRTDARAAVPAGPLAAGQASAEPGLNLRWGVTPNVSLNATLNPDFSQVEADAAQLEVNTRFALFFPEKRPFFLEGADIFRTLAPVVFTRSVVDPVAGIKASGKEGKNAFGVFAARDRSTGLIFPASQGSASTLLGQEVTTGVVRYRRDVGAASTVGVTYTGRVGDAYANHLGSVDAALRLSRSNTLALQYVHSETDYPDSVAAAFRQEAGRFGGGAFIAQFDHASRNWQAAAQFQTVGEGIRGDAGFLPRVGVDVYRGRVERILWGRPGGWFTRLGFNLQGQALLEADGDVADRGLTANVGYLGPRQTSLFLTAGPRQEFYRGTLHDLTDIGFNFEARPNGRVSFGLRGDFGDQVDYANARKGDLLRLGSNVDLRLGRHASLTLDHARERLSTVQGERIFDATVTQGRLVYNFNTRTFVRAIVQLRDVDREQALYAARVVPEQQRVASQLLFSYKVNPQTVLFAGYSDNLLGQQEFDLLRTDRTFFLKLGYAWRM